MTRVLVLGASGMLGHKLYLRLPQEYEVVGVARSASAGLDAIRCSDREILTGVDATNLDAVRSTLAAYNPDVVINCVGVIKQRQEAADPVISIATNALFPQQLKSECERRGTWLIHVSTDCVFSGGRGPYREADSPDPVDLYGRTKLLGEVNGPRMLTLRMSMIGRELSGHHSLLDWFLMQTGRVSGFTNAIFSGLTTNAVADEIGRLIRVSPGLSGVFHLAGERISKFHLLEQVRTAFGLHCELVADPTVRIDRSLIGERYAAATGFCPPAWPEMIADLVRERPSYERPSSRQRRISTGS